jgi:hypothetical protein
MKIMLFAAALLASSIGFAAAPVSVNQRQLVMPEVHLARAINPAIQHSAIAFLQAYSLHDGEELLQVIADDCIFLFPIGASDTYVGVTLDLVREAWDISRDGVENHGHMTGAWLFPTADPNTLFVSYTYNVEDSLDGTSTSQSQHLAELEFRDSQVVRFRELTGRLFPALQVAIARITLKDKIAPTKRHRPSGAQRGVAD